MTRLYNVALACPRCGKRHGVYSGLWDGLVILNGPDRAGTIAELYKGRELLTVIVKREYSHPHGLVQHRIMRRLGTA